jgi:prepilin peptidase CpaA
MMSHVASSLADNWHVWLVTVLLVVAAVIDGYKLKVPNWLTFPMILSGWIFCTVTHGPNGLVESLIGTVVGLGLLLPAYAIGGMGAGDVKLLMGVGAWMGARDTFWAFFVSAVVGGVIALLMVAYHRQWKHHISQFWVILTEILVIRNPGELSAIAADRKPTMRLLPYGIPIAIGSIAYFAWWGMLL